MLHIWRPSGEELTAVSSEDFEDVRALKEHLCEVYSFPVYLQQLLHDTDLLKDDAKLKASMNLQLVLLSLSGVSDAHHATLRLAQADVTDAVERNRVGLLQRLLEAGIDKDSPYCDGKTALMHASSSGSLEAVRFLLEAGADKDCWDRDGSTALMHAALWGRLEVAHLLMQAGARKDCWGNDGKTALLTASAYGHAEVARALLEAGAARDCWDHGGMTALMHAALRGHLEAADLKPSTLNPKP